MELSLPKFEEMVIYSNKTLEKVMSSLVNESSNAVLVATYEDAVLLLDHTSGQFYLSEYKFDNKKATFVFENFEPILLSKNDNNFKNVAEKFFESDDIPVSELAESYKESIISQDEFLATLITESMSDKDFSKVVDYSSLSSLSEGAESKELAIFKKYQERISSNPTRSIKMFNWKDPVKVSLIENEARKIVSKNASGKANDLWKNKEFKDKFYSATKTFIESVEEGNDAYVELFKEYPYIYSLDKADRKSVFGKTIIGSAELREHREDILKGMEILFEKFELADEKKAYLNEADETDTAAAEAPTEDAAPELAPEDLQKIADDLKKISAKVEDEKLKEKIDGIVAQLEGSKEEGTVPAVVKEAVELLSL